MEAVQWMEAKQAAAVHWLHHAPSWRAFPRPTVVMLWDACRYATRDGYVVTYQPPYDKGQGTIIIASPPRPGGGRTFFMIRAMGSVRKLLEAADAWAKP